MPEALLSSSNRDMIAALEIGESYTMSRRLSFGCTQDEIDKAGKSLHDTARAAMARAKTLTNATYTGELGIWYTSRARHPVVCFLITRIK